MSGVLDHAPCPHPIEFRQGADCHLCGNSGFVLPGSPWFPPVPMAAPAQDLAGVPVPSGADQPFDPAAIRD